MVTSGDGSRDGSALVVGLSGTDPPWHDDRLREGDLAIRTAMTRWFTGALTAARHSWVVLTGSLQERFDLAVRVTDSILQQ